MAILINCGLMKKAALPIISDFYNEVNSYTAECKADFQRLQEEGGPLYPKNVAEKRNECFTEITNKFSTLLGDLAAALQFASITADDIYYEILGSTIVSLTCIKVELENILTFLDDKQQELLTEASLHS